MTGVSRTVRRKRRARVIGVCVLALFALMVWVALTATNGVPGQERTSVRASFDTVGALRVGDDVRIADVRVGEVRDIALSDGKAVTTLSFDGDRRLYKNATATINQRSPLGQAYVNVDPGTVSAGALSSATVIDTPAAASAQDLTNVLDVLDDRTRASLRTAVQQAGGGAAGHQDDLHDALSSLDTEVPQLGTVSDALAADNGANLQALLQQTHSLATTFAGQQQELSTLLQQTSATLNAFNDDGGKTLAAILQQAPGTLSSLRAGLSSLDGPLASTRDAVQDLRSGAVALGQATPDLRGLLREAVSPLRKVPGVAQQAVSPLGSLAGLMDQASPLAPELARTISTAATPLSVLAPYSPEVALFFTYATDALKDGDSAGHWLRFYPIISTSTIDGQLMLKDPIVSRDAYPAPGVAATEKQTGLTGTRK